MIENKEKEEMTAWEEREYNNRKLRSAIMKTLNLLDEIAKSCDDTELSEEEGA